jgi:hypothetical protein
MTERTRVRALPLFALSAISIFSLLSTSLAGALQPSGTVTGKVYECPGLANSSHIAPIHASVALIRDRRTWNTQLVTFSRRTLAGSFSISDPAGRYEVVVAIPGYPVVWVTIKSGVQRVVDFGVIACPT